MNIVIMGLKKQQINKTIIVLVVIVVTSVFCVSLDDPIIAGTAAGVSILS